MEESHFNGVTENQTTHIDETILNGNDEVFKGETDSSTELKTTIVLKSTRDESSSTDERSGSEGDQGTEKKYKCVIKARTSVEEYDHSSEGGDEVQSETRPLKVVVRTRSTDETTQDEEDDQSTLNNDKEMSAAIAAQAKEIVQELVKKLEDEATENEEKGTATYEMSISDQELQAEKSEREETQEVENKESVDVEVEAEPALPDAEDEQKVKDKTGQEVDKAELDTSEVTVVGKEEAVEDQPLLETDENMQPVVVQDVEQHEGQSETKTKETQEQDKQKEQQDVIPKTEEPECEEVQQKEEDVAKGPVAVAVVSNEVESSLEKEEENEQKSEVVAMKFEMNEEERDEETTVNEEQIPAVVSSEVKSSPEKEEEKEQKAEVVAMKFEMNEEKRDEETTVNEEQIPAGVDIENQPVTEITEEEVSTVMVVTDQPQDDKNEEPKDEIIIIEAISKEPENNEEETKKDAEMDETKLDKEEKEDTSVAVKFESEEKEERLLTAEETPNVEVDVLPIVEQMPTEDEKGEMIAMKFESEEEVQDEENIVRSEESACIEELPVAANEEEEIKTDGESKAETAEMKFETTEEQADDENLILADEKDAVEAEELTAAENVQEEVKIQDEDDKAETVAETEKEQADKENMVAEESIKVQALVADDVSHKQPETEETRTESEGESAVEVDARTEVVDDALKQDYELSQTKNVEIEQRKEEERKTEEHILTAPTEVHAEMQLTTQDVSSTAFEGEEEPSSPKQEYVAELFNQNTQSLQEIEEGSEGQTDDHLDEKPIVKVRLAEEPFSAISDEDHYDDDVVEVKEAKFDDDETEASMEFFAIGENSDSDGEVDVTIEKHSQENEVLIKNGESDDEGMADDWMAKDDVNEVVFKGTAITVATEKREEDKELDTKQHVTEQKEHLHEETKQIPDVIQDVEVTKSVPEIEDDAQKETNFDREIDEKQEMQLDEKETIPVVSTSANENVPEDKDQSPETMEVVPEAHVDELKETQDLPDETQTKNLEITQQIDDSSKEEAEQEINKLPSNETQDRDSIIIANTKAITVCSDIGDLFPPSEDDVQLEAAPQEEKEEVPEYDVDKEVTEEMQRIMSKYNATTRDGSVAVMEEILPNEQKTKNLEDLNVIMIDDNDEGVATTTQDTEDFEEKPPSPVEAKKVTEEGITEIFETEELRRSGIYDDTLQEEDEETTLQTSGISQKDVVLVNEEYLEASEKEKRGSLRWSLLEKWEEMNKRQSLEAKDESTEEIKTKENISPEARPNEVQTKDSLIVLEVGEPVCTEVEGRSSTKVSTEDKELKEPEQPILEVGIPVYAKPTQKNIVAEREDEEITERNNDKQALVSVPTTEVDVKHNQPQVTEYEFKETSEPVVLETVTTESTPSSVTTVKTTKTTTKTRVIKARSEVQPITMQDGDVKEHPQDVNIEVIEAGPSQEPEQPKQRPLEEQKAYIVDQPSQKDDTTPLSEEDKQASQPEEAPMSTILFRMDGTPVIIPPEPESNEKQPKISKKPAKEQQPKKQPERSTQIQTERELPKQQPDTTQEAQPQMATILFRMDGTPFVVPPPLDRSTPMKTVNFNNEPSVRPVSMNSVESVRGEHDGVPPLAGEEESDIDDSSLHLAKHAHPGPSRAPTVSPVKEMTPPPSPQPRDDDEEKKGDVDSPLLDSSQPEKGQKCCTIL